MSEGKLEVIDLDDTDTDDEEEEESDDSESGGEEEHENRDGGSRDVHKEVVVLSENENSEPNGNDEENSSSEAEDDDLESLSREENQDNTDSSSDESEIQEIVEDEIQEFAINNFPEPGIILESIPVPDPVTEQPSTSKGSKLPLDDFNIEDYECFIDPDDESQTSKRIENTPKEDCNKTSIKDSEQPDILPFFDYVDCNHSISDVAEEELIALSHSGDEIENVGDVISENLNQEPEDVKFRLVGNKIFVNAGSIKGFAPNFQLQTVLEKTERRGWKVSDCLQFSGWDIDYIRLELAEMILPKETKLAEMISQLLPKRSSVNAALTSKKVFPQNVTVKPDPPFTGLKDDNNEEDPPLDPSTDVFEVNQTREMKRKGIRLPKGWKIYGIKKLSEISNNGESYQYFRIDWEFKSPEGRVYQNLKKVLAIIKQRSASRFEKWEVGKPSINQNRSTSIGEHYRRLKQQYEEELDRVLDADVFSVSGIHPVRKFPVNFEYPASSKQTALPGANKEQTPSRMSAMLKTNPVSLAQKEKMMRKAGPAIRRFSLSKVLEVSGLGHEGWFSSKLLGMSYLTKCKTAKFARVQIVPKISEADFIANGKRIKLKHFDEEEISMIKDLTEYLRSFKNEGIPHYQNKSKVVSRCDSQPQIPNFNRKIVQKLDRWPKGWLRKQNCHNLTYISPDGSNFDNIETAMECIKRKSLLNLQNIGQKNLYTPNKRKMFNLELPQKSCSVIRKLPISSLNDLSVSVKKLKMSDEEIEDMVTRDKYYCPSDSVEDLLSGSDDEIS